MTFHENVQQVLDPDFKEMRNYSTSGLTWLQAKLTSYFILSSFISNAQAYRNNRPTPSTSPHMQLDPSPGNPHIHPPQQSENNYQAPFPAASTTATHSDMSDFESTIGGGKITLKSYDQVLSYFRVR